VKKSLIGALIVLAFAAAGRAQDGSRINWPHYQDMAVELMQQYLRINTSNPPGNETVNVSTTFSCATRSQ